MPKNATCKNSIESSLGVRVDCRQRTKESSNGKRFISTSFDFSFHWIYEAEPSQRKTQETMKNFVRRRSRMRQGEAFDRIEPSYCAKRRFHCLCDNRFRFFVREFLSGTRRMATFAYSQTHTQRMGIFCQCLSSVLFHFSRRDVVGAHFSLLNIFDIFRRNKLPSLANEKPSFSIWVLVQLM